MRFRASMIATFSLATGVLFLACTTDYQLGKGDPPFGGPNALAGQRPPGATIDLQGEGGAVVGGGTAGSKPKCVVAGGTQVPPGACTVSFAKDVLGAFGTANCADPNCHGGVTPRNEPRIEPSDGPAMWQEFQNFTLTNGKAYINPCSTDDKLSNMGCNLSPTATDCGVRMPVGASFPGEALTKIETWLKCGSPNN